MTVYVEKASPSEKYSWRVYNGQMLMSRHRKKSAAMREARKIAKRSGAALKEQMQDGTWRTSRNYG